MVDDGTRRVSVVRGGALGRENSLNDYACGLHTVERERERERVSAFIPTVRDSENTFKQKHERGKWRK